MAKIEFTPIMPSMPNPTVVAMAWMELFQSGAAAWTETSVKVALTFAETAQAQAKVFEPMMKPAKPVKAKLALAPEPELELVAEPVADAANDLAAAGLKATIPPGE